MHDYISSLKPNMKGMKIDLFCASQASTAICSSTDHQSMVRLGGRAIDRHNPHLRDSRRISRSLPSSAHQQLLLPSKSKPYNTTHRKSTSSNTTTTTTTTTRKSSAKKTDLTSPPGSTRYLLSHDHKANLFDVLSDFDPVSALVPFGPHNTTKPTPKPKPVVVHYSDESPATTLKSCSSITRSPDQVVVLRVSLHCKGCEGKVRKHISRMEGVTSFSIDFPLKKVTVIGDVTPMGVLASVSRVKNAQFWPSSMTPSSLSVGTTY